MINHLKSFGNIIGRNRKLFTSNNSIDFQVNFGRRTIFSTIFGGNEPDSGNPVRKEITRTLSFTPQQVFNVVQRVDQYQDFLPFCLGSKITKLPISTPQKCSKLPPRKQFEAELTVGQANIKESYISRVVLEEPNFIESSAIDSQLFHQLTSTWKFKPGHSPNTCIAECSLTYKFKSPLYATLMDNFFASTLDTMVNSFEKRCQEVYSPSSSSKNK
ncbi:hypothetical protein DLAC_11662 [Tieghemostelium lacteum]|uniref:Coenzyme Q-binding protein COQ10 START domain-containing protein n=1 Tax=Tieghemostelium lacteum TaxID=361077 RepID=A0A151ZFD4_TIELA|nr:hypothetical protein DLAC_11662 [Tieghemostelium lacteum]|eukprot:KYQ92645.1 hypothetical protein DLAC_11662 [Tieghemostelium lacteum]